MLQHSLDLIVDILTELFIASIILQHIPVAWRGVRVVFIPKLGQPNYAVAKAYRPISLTSFILKTLEKLIDRFLRDVVLKTHSIHPNQYAYQQRKSAESALHHVVFQIEKGMNKKQFALGGFIDLVGAFSNMTFNSIATSCRDHQIQEPIIEWILKMLKDRIVTSYLGLNKASIRVTKGCPQGGVLPPLLYIMVKDSILTILNNHGYHAQSFADDLAVVIIGKFVSTICELMQHAFRLIENWCNDHEQSANPDKTKLILFTRNRTFQGFRAPILFGKEVNLSNSTKVLGVILDAKLNFREHINNRLQKATATLWQCRKVYGKNWGLKPKILLWIYKAIIRPILAYASIIWWPKCHLVSTQKSLSKVQRLALVGVTGVMRTTPTAALEAILNIEPLHIFIEETARKTALRFHHNHQMKYSDKGHAKIWYQMTKENPDFGMPSEKINPTVRFDRAFKVIIPSREEWAEETILPNDGIMAWFTDGSKLGESAGAGIYCPLLQKSIAIPLGKLVTVPQSETLGILRCGQEIQVTPTTNLPIYILTDNQGILKALKGYKFHSSITLECRDIMQKIALKNQVTLSWVPGHKGIPGNEKSDELAREGASTQLTGPTPAIKVSFAGLSRIITSWKKRTFIKSWTSHAQADQSRRCIIISNKNSKYLLSLSRCNIKRLTSVLTGHCTLNKHLYTIGLHHSPICDKCGELETALHFLCCCPAYITARCRIMGKFILPSNNIWSIPLKSILEFLNSTNRV